jgi:sulfur carrier protein
VPPEITACEAAGSRASAALAIRVNGETRRVPAGCRVSDLLDLLAIERRRVAVAVNREVVPRSAHASRTLAAGDRVEILEAVGGG